MWICSSHKSINKPHLEKFRASYDRDYKLNFGFIANTETNHSRLYGVITDKDSAIMKVLQEAEFETSIYSTRRRELNLELAQ